MNRRQRVERSTALSAFGAKAIQPPDKRPMRASLADAPDLGRGRRDGLVLLSVLLTGGAGEKIGEPGVAALGMRRRPCRARFGKAGFDGPGFDRPRLGDAWLGNARRGHAGLGNRRLGTFGLPPAAEHLRPQPAQRPPALVWGPRPRAWGALGR